MSEPSIFLTYFPMLPFKIRNTALDAFFYDIGSLSSAEIEQILLIDAPKGSIIVVPPSERRQDGLRYYQKALRFISKEKEITTVSVAGVGSSLVGAAALARNVADAIGRDVAGIVSGYGVADVLDEALGGWFVYGLTDRIRRFADRTLHEMLHPYSHKPAPRGEIMIPSDWINASSPGLGLPGDDDAITLSDILIARPPKLDLLVGHSKGSLIIDAALGEFDEAMQNDPDPLDHKIKVATIGAVSDIPRRFEHVYQYLGALDWFGGINSRLDLKHDSKQIVGHHLNRFIPFHFDVIEALKQFKHPASDSLP